MIVVRIFILFQDKANDLLGHVARVFKSQKIGVPKRIR